MSLRSRIPRDGSGLLPAPASPELREPLFPQGKAAWLHVYFSPWVILALLPASEPDFFFFNFQSRALARLLSPLLSQTAHVVS